MILNDEMEKKLQRLDNQCDMRGIIDYLMNAVKEGVFTIDELRGDLDAVLWMAYAYLNCDTHETYVEARNWLRGVEEQGADSGVWCYRYAGALLFLGNFEDALKYSEQGTARDPEYPWGWLRLASLRYQFQDVKGALDAIDRGLELVPGDYEFLTMQREIQAGEPFSVLVNHYIGEDADQQKPSVDRLTRIRCAKQSRRCD